ncbi:LysR family transcriptional regulator [Allorhizobium pseudoryzae]|jgi:DNA-binding transcriptional LysR family regulator|uniref:LysR family transcriptional regulator n=1 Tax=Allorhizobium pseudoryzae TaxID=379684 RepID=UPI003D04BF1C
MPLSFRQIRYFIATAEAGQVSLAATNLAISQSAVTAAIKELEETVGASLFDRTQHGMELTDGGRRFLSLAYEILHKVDEATQLKLFHREMAGKLVIAATYTVLGYFLPLHFERLKRRFPDLDIQIFELHRKSVEEGLLTNRYDLAVLLTSNIKHPEIITEKLLSSQRRLWVHSRHHLLGRQGVKLEEALDEDYIMLTVDEASHTSLNFWSQTHAPRVILRTSSVEAVRSLVANGQGVSILSDMVHRPWSLEGRRIETITLQDPVPSMDVGLAWRRNVEFSPAMEAFRSYFRRTFEIPE